MTDKPKKIVSITSVIIILLPTVLSEIKFVYSTKESEKNDAECNGKFSEVEQEETWITVGSINIRALVIIFATFF